MEYQNLLFSRTYNKDHRWILIPDGLTGENLRYIENIMWHEGRLDRYKGESNLIGFGEYSVLCRLTETPYHDSSSRRIFAIDGICVSSDYSYDLRTGRNRLTQADSRVLEGWDLYGFYQMDEMKWQHSPVMYY